MNEFDLPLDQKEKYYQTVWKIVKLIPAGRVSTYGQIAGYIPCPEDVTADQYKLYHARWAGNAMAASPQGVPWQRVINAQGKISIRSGAATQRALLEAEGVIFDAKGRVDLKTFGWEGPSAQWLKENGLIIPENPHQGSFFS